MTLRLAQLADHPYSLSLKSTGQFYASGSLVEHLGRTGLNILKYSISREKSQSELKPFSTAEN